MDDDDWLVYKDDEEQNLDQLNAEIENIEYEVEEFDNTFYANHMEEETSPSILQVFFEGETAYEKVKSPEFNYQLKLNVERIKVPEIVFQPSIIGCESCGLTELIDLVLRKFNIDNFFLTGGNSLHKGLEERIATEIRTLKPEGSALHLESASDPTKDSYRGASRWAEYAHKDKSCWISKSEYLEEGYDRAIKKLNSPFFISN